MWFLLLSNLLCLELLIKIGNASPTGCRVPSVVHGKVLFNGGPSSSGSVLDFGSSISVPCDDGSYVRSYSPTGFMIACPPPPGSNVARSFPSRLLMPFPKGHCVQPECEMDGNAEFLCMGTGQWHPKSPSCLCGNNQVAESATSSAIAVEECPEPPIIRDGFWIVNLPNNLPTTSNRSIGVALEKRCNQCYELVGSSTRFIRCGNDLQWTTPSSFCTYVGCPSDSATTANLEVTPPTSFSVSDQCPEPPSLSNGYWVSGGRVETNRNLGAFLEMRCKQCYGLHGVSTQFIRCGEDLQWTNPSTFCTYVGCNSDTTVSQEVIPAAVEQCPEPPTATNGYWMFNGHRGISQNVGTLLEMRCNECYDLIGTSTAFIRCSWDLRWSTTTLICSYVGCSRKGLRPIPFEYESTTLEPITTTTTTTTFIPTTSKRKVPRRCPEPPLVSNGFWVLNIIPGSYASNRSIGTELEKHCYPCYELQGSGTPLIRCDEDLQWTGTSTFCSYVGCPTQSTSEMKYRTTSIRVPENEGTTMEPTTRRKATTTRATTTITTTTITTTTTTTSKPDIPALCSEPPLVRNGFWVVSKIPGPFATNRSVGAVLEKQCYPCYERLGSTTPLIRCDDDRQWTGTSTSCNYVGCPTQSTSTVKMRTTSVNEDITTTSQIVAATCLEPPTVNNGYWFFNKLRSLDPNGSNRSIGAVLEKRCNKCYEPIGKTTPNIRCGQDLEWTSTNVYCDFVGCQTTNASIPDKSMTWLSILGQCPDPPIVNNGYWAVSRLPNISSIATNRSVGVLLEKRCNKCFKLIGSTTPFIRCGRDLEWNSTTMSCTPIECSSDDISVDEQPSTAIQLRKTTTSPSIFAECPSPPPVSNGYWVVNKLPDSDSGSTNRSIGAVLEKRCNKCFEPIGSGTATIRCLQDLSWTTTLFYCKATDCPSDNVFSRKSDSTTISNIEPSVQSSRRLKATTTPTILGQCPEPPLPSNGYWVVSKMPDLATDRSVGAVLEKRCNKCFEPVGSGSPLIRCSQDLTWNTTSIRCKATGLSSGVLADCTESPASSIMAIEFTTRSNTLDLISKARGEVMSSSIGQCPDPPNPNNGYWTVNKLPTSDSPVTNRSIGTILEKRCNKCFELAGSMSPQIQCSEDLQWTSTSMSCKSVANCASDTVKVDEIAPVKRAPQCSDPPEISNGYWVVNKLPDNDPGTTNRSVGTIVEVRCQSCYERVGSSTPFIRCGRDLQWTRTSVACKVIECQYESLPRIEHGNAVLGPSNCGSSKYIICDPGYVRNKDAIVQCQNDTSWIRSFQPLCIVAGSTVSIGCKKPELTIGGQYSFDKSATDDGFYPPRTKASFFCKWGYKLAEQSILTCSDDGTWLGSNGLCLRIRCLSLPQVNRGIYRPSADEPYYADTTATLICSPGLQAFNATTIKCDISGNWEAPGICVPGCRTLPTINNGRFVSASERAFPPAVAHLQCNSGFQVAGDDAITCLLDGSWTSPLASCQ